MAKAMKSKMQKQKIYKVYGDAMSVRDKEVLNMQLVFDICRNNDAVNRIFMVHFTLFTKLKVSV